MNKDLHFDQSTILSFQDKNAGKLYIYYDGCELCFAIDNYTFDKNHRITRNSELYLPMKKALEAIRKNDSRRNVSMNRFEWISESYRIPEVQNTLVIYEIERFISMHFIKNKYNAVDKDDMCSIHFSLMDSKNKSVAKIFNEMYIDLCNKKMPSKILMKK